MTTKTALGAIDVDTESGTPAERLREAFNSPPLFPREELVRRVLENIPLVGIFIAAEDGTILYASPTAERILDYRFRGELAGKSIDSLLPETLREAHVRHRAAFFEHPHERPMGDGMRLEALRRDGSLVQVRIALKPEFMLGVRVAIAAIAEVRE